MSDTPPPNTAVPIALEDLVAPRVSAVSHPAGPAVRISDGGDLKITLIVATQSDVEPFLSALRLRVAPWAALRMHMEAEMRAASAQTVPSPTPGYTSSLADAARLFFSGVIERAAAEKKQGMTGLAGRVWEKASAMAEMSIWTATFAQGIGGVARSAEEVGKLSKPLGGLTIVGCAFSLVALSARAVGLMALEREGRDVLAKAREGLRGVNVVGVMVV